MGSDEQNKQANTVETDSETESRVTAAEGRGGEAGETVKGERITDWDLGDRHGDVNTA